MTKVSELSARDIAGAAHQWNDYLTNTLGFARAGRYQDSAASVDVSGSQITVKLYGHDSFQADTDYSRKVGQLFHSQPYPMDADWDEVCTATWDALKRCMPRDERELRHSMQIMGKVIEDGKGYETEIGSLIANRIKAVRDDANGKLIEFQKARAA